MLASYSNWFIISLLECVASSHVATYLLSHIMQCMRNGLLRFSHSIPAISHSIDSVIDVVIIYISGYIFVWIYSSYLCDVFSSSSVSTVRLSSNVIAPTRILDIRWKPCLTLAKFASKTINSTYYSNFAWNHSRISSSQRFDWFAVFVSRISFRAFIRPHLFTGIFMCHCLVSIPIRLWIYTLYLHRQVFFSLAFFYYILTLCFRCARAFQFRSAGCRTGLNQSSI